ncbi:hypothetical protein BKA61DRAFT_258633 [Leptodontidium sp. MPI-SDFR-AT-0119]|nr:hypothetical protein BKA61DRAFT_258633 [Leptodontidium sp. MPI-SDFR-AT-0119]
MPCMCLTALGQCVWTSLGGVGAISDNMFVSSSQPLYLLRRQYHLLHLQRTSFHDIPKERSSSNFVCIFKEQFGHLVFHSRPQMMSEIRRISPPPPDNYVRGVARIALEELWTVEILPDILVESSITLSHNARQLIHDITAELSYLDCLLLCCIKWEFNASPDADPSWAFYIGHKNQDLTAPVGNYNKQTGYQITTGDASSRFAWIKKTSEARLLNEYRYSMQVARAWLQLGTSSQFDVDYVEYLCNQVYNFCTACLQDSKSDLDRLMLRHWYEQGRCDTPRSILELERMTASSEYLVTSANFERAFRLATIAYCGLVIPTGLRNIQKLESMLACLRRLSEAKALQASSVEVVNLRWLATYTRKLQRQLPSKSFSRSAGGLHPTSEGLFSPGYQEVESDEGDVDTAVNPYLKILGNLSRENQARIDEEEKKQEVHSIVLGIQGPGLAGAVLK